jgi:hypothetical protein
VVTEDGELDSVLLEELDVSSPALLVVEPAVLDSLPVLELELSSPALDAVLASPALEPELVAVPETSELPDDELVVVASPEDFAAVLALDFLAVALVLAVRPEAALERRAAATSAGSLPDAS